MSGFRGCDGWVGVCKCRVKGLGKVLKCFRCGLESGGRGDLKFENWVKFMWGIRKRHRVVASFFAAKC